MTVWQFHLETLYTGWSNKQKNFKIANLVGLPIVTSQINWFDNRTDYERYVRQDFSQRRMHELEISKLKVWKGYCVYCRQHTKFQVSVGLFLGENVHLREGLVCKRCGLSNRLRLLYKTIEDFCGGPHSLRRKKIYVAERLSNFYFRLAERAPNLMGSEYLDPALKSGAIQVIGHLNVMHQDLCSTSFKDNSFDLVVHTGALEHVAGYRRALSESFRIISPGGATIFTMPFLHDRYEHEIRATLSANGVITHHLPAAYHGNPLDPAGSFVYQTFGWQLLDDLRAAGFGKALIGVLIDLQLGFTSSNSPGYEYMEPVVFMATK